MKIICLAALAGAAIAAEPIATSNKVYVPSIHALNKAFASGDAKDLKGFLSKDFAIEGYSADMRKQALEQAFSKAKGKVSGLSVVRERKTRNGYDLTLKAANGNRFDVSVDEGGKFTALKFFAAKTASPANTKATITAPSYETQPFKLFGAGGLIMVKGVVNGVEGYLLVDTGAERSMLNSEVFPNLTGEAIGTQGVNGEINQASLVPVESMKLGKIELKGITAVYQPIEHLSFGRKDVKVLGLLGHNELAHFELILNYPKKLVTFFTLKENGERAGEAQMPEPVKTIKFNLEAHLPVIDCEVGGQKLRMGLDTGAEINLIDRMHREKLGELLQNKRVAESVGADNRPVEIIVGTMPEFSVHGRDYPNMKTVFTDISHLTAGKNGMDIDGMLGFQFLSKNRLVSINFVKKELTLW